MEELVPAASPVSLWCGISPEPARPPRACRRKGVEAALSHNNGVQFVLRTRMPSAASPLPAAAESPAPLRAPHLRGWHNELCPCLNLPLPLPAASVLPAGLFFLSFFSFFFSFLPLFSSGSQPVLAHSPCWRPPPGLTFATPLG